MPVVFVLFKGVMEKSASWVSRMWSSRTRSSRARGAAGGGGGPGGTGKSFDPSTGATSSSRGGGHNPYQEVGGSGGHKSKSYLPQVPRGAMTGLRSFVRNVGRSRPLPATTATRTQQDDYAPQTDVMLTMMSADYDYHGHIRNDSGVTRVGTPKTGTMGGAGGAGGSNVGGSESVTRLVPGVEPQQSQPQPQQYQHQQRQQEEVILPQQQHQQSQGYPLGHFTEGFHSPGPNDLHDQFVDDNSTHDFLGQLRKTSTIGQAR